MPDHREAPLRGLSAQPDPDRRQGRVDAGKARKVRQRLWVPVDLVVDLGLVALVGAEDCGECVQLDPPPQQLSGAAVVEEGDRERGTWDGRGDVAADVGVVLAEAREATGEDAGDAALDAVAGSSNAPKSPKPSSSAAAGAFVWVTVPKASAKGSLASTVGAAGVAGCACAGMAYGKAGAVLYGALCYYYCD